MHQIYPKIKESFNVNSKLTNEWVLTEKVHGANLSLSLRDGNFNLAKRKEILSPDEFSQFFNVDKIYPSLFAIKEKLQAEIGDNWVLYGELAGGGYPGEAAVQQGVYYAHDLFFTAFDLLIDNYFISYDDFVLLSRKVSLETVPLLARGKYNQLINHPVNFITKVPALFNLKGLENNLAEGWVLKPASRYEASSRPILKKKREEFSEEGGQLSVPKSSTVPAWLLVLAFDKLTTGRISAARSKVGISHDAISQEASEDILSEITQELGELEKDVISELKELISNATASLLS